jgi:hypothetical protein
MQLSKANKNPPLRPEQLIMFVAGVLLLASGLIHVVIWVVDGSSLSGPVSWRKPILFGFSAGVTVISLAWVAGKMKRHVSDLWMLPLFSAAMLIEVGLITMQQWRGVASHFNRSTPFDANVLSWIEYLIIFASLVIAALTWRSFGQLATNRDMALAIRGGMSLLLFACLFGFVMVGYGNYRVAMGYAPEIFGAAGVMKFPHGMPIHAIQYLPVLSWLLRKLGLEAPDRRFAIGCALASIVSFTAFSLLQTFTGRARFDVTLLSGSLLVVSILFVAPLVQGVFRRTFHS